MIDTLGLRMMAESEPDVRSTIERVSKWAAVRTAARWEKSVAEQLRQAGVPSYLPLMTRVSRSQSKTQSAQVPLFSGYVFCGEQEFRDNKRLSWSCRKKIAQLLITPNPARMKDELLTIAGVLANRQLVQERFFGTIGGIVRIVGGPLVGQVGEIIRLIPNSSRIVLEVSFLGARVEATVEDRYLEKMSVPARKLVARGAGCSHSKAG